MILLYWYILLFHKNNEGMTESNLNTYCTTKNKNIIQIMTLNSIISSSSSFSKLNWDWLHEAEKTSMITRLNTCPSVNQLTLLLTNNSVIQRTLDRNMKHCRILQCTTIIHLFSQNKTDQESCDTRTYLPNCKEIIHCHTIIRSRFQTCLTFITDDILMNTGNQTTLDPLTFS